MRDMTMVVGADTVNGAVTLPLTPLSPEQELATRVRLSQALQMSLDTAEILNQFYKHIQSAVPVSGLIFKNPNHQADLKVGRDCVHHCDYRLTTDEGYLGEIIFTRSKRFVESELITLEFLLSSLIYPLRNSIRYQAALRLAMLDPLTMLGNRAAMDTALRRELQLAERHYQDLSLLLIDADHFKKINDDYGHHRGDIMLCEIAKGIQSVCRGTDITFRYGGEEFVVLLGKTNAEGAKIIAERIRQQIEKTFISHNGNRIGTTVSVGIATHHAGKKEHLNELFERADTALYQAKANGRNCVAVCDGVILA